MANTQAQTQETRYQIGSEPTIQPIIKVKNENLYVEEGPTQVNSSSIGNSWIAGSSTNGIVGVNTGTQGGGQQVVGGSGRIARPKRVTNNNNKHIERYFQTNFDESNITTADWDGDGELDFTSGEVAQSTPVYYDSGIASSATVTVEGTGTGNLSLELSTDGVIFSAATFGVQFTFSAEERAIYYKITASGSATLTVLFVDYNTTAINEIPFLVDELDNNVVDESGNFIVGFD